MNILLDYHHGALLRSMYYLFHKRLNFEVFLPTNFEWHDIDGLYSCYNNRNIADQMLNSWRYASYNYMFKPMILQEFIDRNDIDIVVASLWENHVIYDKIIKKYNKKCKLILQAGNNILREHVYMANAKNLLSSAYPTYITTENINKVFYHQEFDLNLFKPDSTLNVKSVANFKHIMEDDINLILELEKIMPDWEFKLYGANNRDGMIDDDEVKMSTAIKKFGFIFHVKKDEGYGHVIHNSFACGKPMIVDLKTAGVHRDKRFIQNTASFLYEKNKTILDSNDKIEDLVYKLNFMADNYQSNSEYVYKKFREIVNFEEECIKIQKFLGQLT